jgi:hypothetical protein
MANFAALSKNVNHSLWKEIYGILSRGQGRRRGFAADGVGRHGIEDIDGIQRLMWDHIIANRVLGGERFEALDKCRERFVYDVKGIMERGARDGIYNPVSGLGTLDDPQMYTSATIPVSVSPFEATALYASGGLPAIIIDKKSKGILTNGITFKTYDDKFWDDERVDKLLKEVDRTGFDEKISAGLRDATLYGGAAVYPIFRDDSAGSFAEDFKTLLKSGVIGREKIDRWAQVDRWNTVYVCNYDPSAGDYLHPRSFYIPISGIEVATSRCCVLRLRQLPYWGGGRYGSWGGARAILRGIYGAYTGIM